MAKVEKMLGIQNLYEQRNIELTHQLNAALKAWNLFHRDQQYIVKDGEVIIVDEFTGRLMYGRRYSDGIHQAIEAKEGIKVAARIRRSRRSRSRIFSASTRSWPA